MKNINHIININNTNINNTNKKILLNNEIKAPDSSSALTVATFRRGQN